MSSDEVLCGEEKKPEESLDHLSCYDTVWDLSKVIIEHRIGKFWRRSEEQNAITW